MSSSFSPSCHVEHHVTKLDTLAGVAIKYGVEVADIKKTNGLVSDLQMFARKTLLIPLPGRHPPSLSNDQNDRQGNNDRIPPRRARSATFFDSFQSLSTNLEQNNASSMLKDSRRCKSMANVSEIGERHDKWVDKHILRCPKLEVVDNPRASRGLFSTLSGKSLALRKAPTRINLNYEGENSGEVRKSSSTPSLHEQETNLTCIWPDIQAALVTPIFNGLIKSTANQRVKTAID